MTSELSVQYRQLDIITLSWYAPTAWNVQYEVRPFQLLSRLAQSSHNYGGVSVQDLAEYMVRPQQNTFNRPSLTATHPGNMPDDGRKDRKRKEVAGRLSREMNDRRDE